MLALPDDEGFDLAAWLVPGLAALLGRGGRGPRGASLAAPGRAEPHAGEPVASERLDIDLDRYDL